MAFFKECDDILNSVIGEHILRNQKLCKLLYCYPDEDEFSYNDNASFNYNPLAEPDIKDTRKLLMNNIFPIPKSPDLTTEQTGFLTVVLSGGDRHYDDENDGYRRMYLIFDIVIHLKHWIIQDSFRAYKIAEELDKMFNNRTDNLFGKINYIDFKQRDYSNHFYGLQLIYGFSVNSNIECNSESKIFKKTSPNECIECKVLDIDEKYRPSFLPKSLGINYHGNI